MKEIVQGLWWPKLGAMERLSICSFLANGYDYHLYAYGPVTGTPPGTTVKDANEIMPYKQYGHLAQFADHFRYKLLYKLGGWWVDTDVVCLKKFDSPDLVFSSEQDWEVRRKARPNNVVMKAPAGHDALAWMLNRCENTDPNTIWEGKDYTALGPKLMKEMLDSFHLHECVTPPATFCPIHCWESGAFVSEGHHIADFSKSSAFHLWHGMWKRENRPTNVFTGLYGELQDRYIQGSGRILVALVTCAKYRNRAQRCLDSWVKNLPGNFDLKVCDGRTLGIPDDYESLNLKIKTIMAYAFSHGYDWVLKVDDDTDIRTGQLKLPGADYAGWASLYVDSDCPWPHCQGGCYWLSRNAMEIVANAPLDPLVTAEDRWVGKVLNDRGIKPFHLKDFVINPTCQWVAKWRPPSNNLSWTVMLQAEEIGIPSPIVVKEDYITVIIRGKEIRIPKPKAPKYQVMGQTERARRRGRR